jgi:hypothetical protein
MNRDEDDGQMTVELNIPHSAEEREEQRLTGGWDRSYASLPEDLKRKLSIYDFKRLGDCFRQAFDIPASRRPIPPTEEPEEIAAMRGWIMPPLHVPATLKYIDSLKQRADAAEAELACRRSQRDEVLTDEQVAAMADAWIRTGDMDMPGTNRRGRHRIRIEAMLKAMRDVREGTP